MQPANVGNAAGENVQAALSSLTRSYEQLKTQYEQALELLEVKNGQIADLKKAYEVRVKNQTHQEQRLQNIIE